MADLESVATLQAKQEITRVFRAAFDKGKIGIEERKITKPQHKHDPRDIVYQPIPSPFRFAFGETMEQMHLVREGISERYRRVKAWAYSNIPCIYI